MRPTHEDPCWRGVFLIIVATIGIVTAIRCPGTPAPKPTPRGLSTNTPAIVNQGGGEVYKSKPTLTQSQLKTERDAAIDFAIYYTLNIEARLQRLERLRPLLPEVRQ